MNWEDFKTKLLENTEIGSKITNTKYNIIEIDEQGIRFKISDINKKKVTYDMIQFIFENFENENLKNLYIEQFMWADCRFLSGKGLVQMIFNIENINTELKNYLEIIKDCLGQIYLFDEKLFNKNKERGISERCLAFRFAYYLQQKYESEYIVDCDYNSSYDEEGNLISGKPILDENGNTVTNRFLDIIVHKRTKNISRNNSQNSDLICFEIKKWNNLVKKEVKIDINNLKYMTRTYGYRYGFHIIFGKEKNQTKISAYNNGYEIIKKEYITNIK